MATTVEQIKELAGRLESLARHIDIDGKRERLREEEAKSLAPGFWDNPDEAEKQLKAAAQIKSWTTAYDGAAALTDDLQLMPDFIKEGAASEEELDEQYARTLQAIEELEMRNMLQGKAPSWTSTPEPAVPKRSTGRRCFTACTCAGAS